MDGEAVLAAFAGFEAAREALAGLSVESLTAAQTLTVLQMRERGHRRDLAIDHALTARLIDQADPHEMGATSIKKLLTERLRITDADAGDRLTDARQLGPKYTLTGERLQSDLPHTADALSRGVIGVAHVRIIQDFVKRLPTWVSFARRDDYEHDLVTHAQTLVPEDFRKVAETLLAHIDQDGAEPDYPTQQRRRTVTVGRQQADGMSHLDGWIDPEFRAFLDVVLAKHAAPGANLPHHDTHHDTYHDTHDAAHDDTHDDTHDAARTGRDHRTAGQRHHDAIKTVLRDTVASGRLGQVAGVPATIVASTTLGELERAAGWAHTGGGNRLPLRDLIRMAATSRHEQGLPHGSARPFGYEPDKITIRPAEAKVIREMVDRYLAGASIRSLTIRLNDTGVAPAVAKSWQTTAVRQILISGRIAGLREHHGEVIGAAAWPAIITPAERDRILARMTARSVTKTRAPRTYLLSGMLRCGRCGNRLFPKPAITIRLTGFAATSA